MSLEPDLEVLSQTGSESDPHSSISHSAPSSNLNTSLQLLPPHRDPDLWYEDGNMILIGGGSCAFRIYRGLLAVRSRIFHDMISSSSARSEEMVDGCPVVHLTDTPHELRDFLHALMPSPSLPHSSLSDTTEKISPEALLAIARLAHKYDVDGLLHQAIKCLQTCYSTRFDIWSQHLENSRFLTTASPNYAIGVINLARLTGIHSMLPVAFYECCALKGALVHGWKREDGVVERLSDADLERCINGAHVLARAHLHALPRVFKPTTSSRCREPAKCKAAIQSQADHLLNGPDVARADVALLSRLTVFDGLPEDSPTRADKRCTDMLRERDLVERRTLWAALPVIFNIEVPGWSDGQA
ncbi:hypothetical protein C2E23DRAFT_722542 [Lenzites betulinus]|nr:hypothetical protein C2E23DRAFT_722542 [Lenzites betulinus]